MRIVAIAGLFFHAVQSGALLLDRFAHQHNGRLFVSVAVGGAMSIAKRWEPARRWSLGAVAILAAVVGHGNVVGQTVTGQEPRIGTWKLNLEKSQFAAGTAPQMQVRRLQSRGDGFVVFTQVGLDAEGSPTFIQTTYRFDGRPYPEYTQTSLAQFASLGTSPAKNIYRLVDAYTVEIDRLDTNGNVTVTSKQSMSRDGRLLTVTSATRPTQVWDKQ
jgi:hypothetical protein